LLENSQLFQQKSQPILGKKLFLATQPNLELISNQVKTFLTQTKSQISSFFLAKKAHSGNSAARL